MSSSSHFATAGGECIVKSCKHAVALKINPLGPHHAVVIPTTTISRLADLSESEYAALWCFVRETEAQSEEKLQSTASNISVYDGPDTGSPVPSCAHVHVVVLLEWWWWWW